MELLRGCQFKPEVKGTEPGSHVTEATSGNDDNESDEAMFVVSKTTVFIPQQNTTNEALTGD